MLIREPAVAGRFYSRDPDRCRAEVDACLVQAARPAARGEPAPPVDRILGGIVPHAGWMCSGGVAARVLRELASRPQPDVAVIFGAVHVPYEGFSSLFPSGAWRTPLGLAGVEDRVARRFRDETDLLTVDPLAHHGEHSIEVEVPFLQRLLPQTLIVPIMVQADPRAAELGAAVGRACRDYGVRAVFLASTDLTHYGPSYGFIPEGVGPQAIRWASDVNDRRMIDLILALHEGDAVGEAMSNRNACGAGAVAATLAACKECGAGRATLLEHTNSYEVLRDMLHEPPRDAVGYAAVVIHE